MTAITATMVKELRDKTDAGMMDCKKALTECAGDAEKAVAWLREKGLSKAAKKAGRATSEGRIVYHIAQSGKTAALVEIKCETDFVAKNEKFQAFAAALVKEVAEKGVPGGDLAQAPSGGPAGENAADGLAGLIAVLGENMALGRFVRYELAGEGGFGVYIHSNGKIGVLVEFAGPAGLTAKPGFAEMAKDVAMQVAAASPICVTSGQVPADLLAKEKDIYKNQAMAEGKPEAIAEKIVMGRISKFYKDVCLLEQPFIKDDKKSIGQLLKEAGKALGGEVSITRFTRLALGEDAEKE